MITLASCFGHQEPGKDLTITCNGPGPELTARGWIRGCERNPEPTQTKAQVLKKWGPPDEKHVVSGVEHWLYKDESSWGGEVAYFFVPIPFPVRKPNYRTDLTFAGDNLTLIHIRRGTRTGSICGLLPMPEYVPFYPGCSHFEGDRHASDGWMIQDRSDTRVLPPGSKMFWIDDHYWLSQQEFIDSGARCATKPPIETERAAIEAHLGPLVAERALRTAASPTGKKVTPWQASDSKGKKLIDVYFHIIAPSDSRPGRLGPSDAESLVLWVNASFSGTGWQFKLVSTDYTTNDAWFGMEQGSNAERQAKIELRKGTARDLNIYSAAPAGGQLGWATFPWTYAANPSADGVVIQFSTIPFGPGAAENPFRRGSNLAHQIGHWMGLYHTFQGGCSETGDFIDDTPAEASPAFDCPEKRNTCKRGEDPIHNFMNFTDDL